MIREELSIRVLIPSCSPRSERSIAPRGDPSPLIDTRIHLVSFLSAKWPGDPRIPTGSFLSDSTLRYLSKFLFFFLFSLPEESRMHEEREQRGRGSARGADAPRRRKGGDKCRLLFEKPHALAPAWHVAGACVCEPRSLLLFPLSKWPRMFRPLVGFHEFSSSGLKKSPLISFWTPRLLNLRVQTRAVFYAASPLR